MAKTGSKTDPEESNRMWASASFVGVLIIIGLPLWWKTTEVYRVSLPYDKIASFSSLPHTITAELVVLANDDATATEIADLIDKEFRSSDVIKLQITKAVLPHQLQRTIDAVADEIEATEEVGNAFDIKSSNKFYVVQRRNLFQGVWLGPERVMLFRDSKASTTIVETLKRWVYQLPVLEGARSEIADPARRTRFPPSPGYHIVLSIILPSQTELDIEEAFEDYIGSFVDELSHMHNFTLKSQFLYMLNFDFQAKEVKDTSEFGRQFSIRRDRLHLVLTKLEERAGTRVPDQPALNLALYRVPCYQAPLIIYDNDKPIESPVQAFMSPKWGGVVLSNPTARDCADGSWSPNVRLVMGTFLSQLRKLLGFVDADVIPNAHMEPLRSVSPRKWETDNLLRIRTLELITSAERTLQSLAQLLGEISNIVINDDVGAYINRAVESTQLAAQLAVKGELYEAYTVAQEAATAAETAFMDPSLLALLYFPDDQKYAIYIPLFLPIMFPVVLSLKNLFLWLRGKPVNKEKME